MKLTFSTLAVLGALALSPLAHAQGWPPPAVRADPAPEGRMIDEEGLIANFYPAQGVEGAAPAILLLGGSEGGIGPGTTRDAKALAAEGFAVLSVSYYRLPGQPEVLELVPIETFGTALAWLGKQAEVDADRIAIVGASKGAEAALLAATRFPQIDAVVAGMPSSVVWQGMSWEGEVKGSTWTEGGEPLPFVPYASDMPFTNLGELYANSLTRLDAHEDAIIPVETIGGPVLLVCGEKDSLWPACPMARQVAQRADKVEGAPDVTILAYEDAGHAVYGPPATDPSGLSFLGGSDAGNNAARADGWPKVIAFLKQALAAD